MPSDVSGAFIYRRGGGGRRKPGGGGRRDGRQEGLARGRGLIPPAVEQGTFFPGATRDGGGGRQAAPGEASGGCGWPASDSGGVTVHLLARGAQREPLPARWRRAAVLIPPSPGQGADLLRQGEAGALPGGGIGTAPPGWLRSPAHPPPAPSAASSSGSGPEEVKRSSASPPRALPAWLAGCFFRWLSAAAAAAAAAVAGQAGLDGAVHQCGAEMASGASPAPWQPKVVGRPRGARRRRGWRAGGSCGSGAVARRRRH